ncbi:glycerophosphodiester phosphodiesterase [Marinactinospora thermotolerans]|uniref:Glycerophosphoryl diester phosphodiesterase n=1 Tax=Marinactinospora thermotolerans DSM 45154 TaxID=1122192 RepID=A0A1T4QN62_9ACTN|nr:glycerophosphodiester phosphodiesterase [Marinactinospora thermotolerans]SKA05203.1 glycerophosphoryl diester phosphodiesterase [Marinactinospora thermotolerans DSM 45154]
MTFTAPEVIGHRGAGRGTVDGLRENSAESFAAAVAAGATWVEIDVRRSADGVLLIHHDAALADGQAIVDLPAAEGRRAGLLTLEEALEAIPADIGLDVDVKTVMEDASDPRERRTMTLLLPHLRREARRRRLFVCSFDPAVLLAVQAEAPGIPTAWMPFVRNPLDQAVAGAAGLGCQIVAIDARSFGLAGDPPRPGRRTVDYTVEVAHRAGLEVVSWCPGPADAARFAAAGVDAVVVDDVAGVVAALDGR